MSNVVLTRSLSREAIEQARRIGLELSPLARLAEVHRRLWDLEDQARSRNATSERIAAVKREIDTLNHERHAIIDSFDASYDRPSPRGARRSYTETPGELSDRLIVLQLKLDNVVRLQSDATLPEPSRRKCIEKAIELGDRREYLQQMLEQMLADLATGEASLPPRCEFKMYNDPVLNPVTRDFTDPPQHPTSRNKPGTRTQGIRHILGIACTGHGASLAYLDSEGTLRASVLDRWAGTKHTLLFAADEARAIFARETPTDASIHDVLCLGFGRLPPHLVFEQVFPHWLSWLLSDVEAGPDDIDLVVTSNGHFATCEHRLGRQLPRWLPRARVLADIEHHAIHQRQAFWASGFDEAAVLTLDTCGEALPRLGNRKLAGTIALMRRDGTCAVQRELLFPQSSAGLVYATVTRHLGFRQGEEGKTMGLAPYGTPALYDQLEPHLVLHEGGSFEMMNPRSLSRVLERYVPMRDLDARNEFGPRHRDVAYAGQAIVEQIVEHTARWALELTGQSKLAYAGGVALNSVANGRVMRNVGPRQMYVAPNPGDSGHALGCALFGAYEIARWPAPESELPEYHGPRYDAATVEEAAATSMHHRKHFGELSDVIARIIGNGHIVARFGGRAEFGPRALGNRSILCDPRRLDMKEYLNSRVKFREAFRPFAPSVLAEHADEWFELSDRSPFMLQVVPVRNKVATRIPAVVHVDGTARVQTVDRRENPAYWQVIESFFRLTNVPMVLNTSFNINGKPIVESPRDAVACFESTNIDVLALDDQILSKRPLDDLVERSR